jgi:hypothetical protein
VNSERLYKRSRLLLRVGSRKATLCLFVAPRQRTVTMSTGIGSDHHGDCYETIFGIGSDHYAAAVAAGDIFGVGS